MIWSVFCSDAELSSMMFIVQLGARLAIGATGNMLKRRRSRTIALPLQYKPSVLMS